ncbi:MAG: response regulator [Muribaculaceae bacterium]|nr:response regulator [Muribaculaceae bacterium]
MCVVKILVIDDNQAIRTALKLVAGAHFGEVVTVGDPTLLPALLRAGDVDAVLLDMNFGTGRLDGSDGLFWLRRIKESAAAPAVVLITAFGDISLAVEAMKAGADDFITKPWDNSELIGKIEAAIERNRTVASQTRDVRDAREIMRRNGERRNMTLEELKLHHIREIVDECDGNLSEAARRLGVNRQTLYNLLRRQ